MFLRLLGIYRSACFDILFVSILWTCCSHFFWCCFISFAMFCAPVFPLIYWLFSFRFLWNLIFKYVLKICWENSSFIKIWQEQQVLYMENYVHLWYYLAEFFLEWDIFQTKVVETMERHILFSITSFFISFFFHFFFTPEKTWIPMCNCWQNIWYLCFVFWNVYDCDTMHCMGTALVSGEVK